MQTKLISPMKKRRGVLLGVLVLAALIGTACSGGTSVVWNPNAASEVDEALADAQIALTEPTAAPAPVEHSDWFVLKAQVANRWEIIPDPDDDLRVTLVRPGEPPGAVDQKHVMVLYPRPSSSYDTAMSKILDVLDSRQIPVYITVINFNRDEALGLAALDYARAEQVDLLFSMGSESTDFAFNNFQNETIPVVTICSKDPVLLGYVDSYEATSGNNFAYTSLNAPIDLQMLYLQALNPNLQTIAVMYDDTNKSAKETQVEPLRVIAPDYGITILDVVSYSRDTVIQDLETGMAQAIQEINQTDPTHQSSIFWITGSTTVFNEIETIGRLAGDIPVLSVVPDVVLEGENSAVLSIGVTFESNGQLAASYGADILEGRVRPGDLPVGIVSPPDIAVNFLKARQIGLQIPFNFFESASLVYDYSGKLVRLNGQLVTN